MAVALERDPVATRQALGRWLAQRTGVDHVEVGELTIPGLSGFSNETIVFDATWPGQGAHEPRGIVVRVEPSGHQVFPSTAFDEQVRVLRALHEEGSVPVPEVLWFEEDTSVLGDRFVAMERVDGRVPADVPSYHVDGWLAEGDDAARRRVWESGVDAMAAVHRLDLADPRFAWIRPRTPAEQLELDRSYRGFAAGDDPFPIVDAALEVLAATVPRAPAGPAVCWGDARIGNMIFGSDGGVAAVLDWEMLTAGDPVQDLAWYLLIDRHHHEGFGVPRLSGLPDRASTVARWEAATGRSAEHLGWYELLGGVRYALIATRVLQLLDATDILPGSAAMARDHTGTQLLQRLLDERA